MQGKSIVLRKILRGKLSAGFSSGSARMTPALNIIESEHDGDDAPQRQHRELNSQRIGRERRPGSEPKPSVWMERLRRVTWRFGIPPCKLTFWDHHGDQPVAWGASAC